MDDSIAQDHQLFHYHQQHSPTAALPNPKRIKLDPEYKMPYQRPAYQQHPYQPHYQQRVMHASGPTPPDMFSVPQARQQHFLQSYHDVHGAFNQGYNRQATSAAGFNSIHQATQPPLHAQSSQVTNTMMMDSNNYNGAMKHEAIEPGCGGGDGCGDPSDVGHTSQNFPDEEYYCDDRPSPAYRHQNLSQKQIPPDAFYRAYGQAIERRHHYDSPAAASDYRPDDFVNVMPQSQFAAQRPRAGAYHEPHQQMHHHHHHQARFGLVPTRMQHYNHQRQQQQQSRYYYKTANELHPQNEPLRPYELPAPVYSDHRVNQIEEYLDDFQPPMSQDYIHHQTASRRVDRFEGHYTDHMDSPQESQQLYQHTSDEQQQQQQQQQQHYTVQPEQLVRQEMGLNPRKISRVSASAITSPGVANYQSAARHAHGSHLNNDQYPSGDTDTYRVVASTSPGANDDRHALSQQPYPSTPFVESVSSDQTDEYSSFESSPPVAGAMSSSNQSQHDQQQQQQSPQRPQVIATQQQQQQQRRQQQQQGNYIDMRSSGTVSQDWLDIICRHMIEHMNNFGICVIDNFLGSIKGEAILDEVLQLYSERNYTTGRLVSDARDDENGGESGADNKEAAAAAADRQLKLAAAAADPARLIRNDRVIWVDGCEDGCSEINNLIQTLCSVITNSSRLSLYTGNALDKIVINKRTKAHVACYPGNRTRYIKHVDNPNNDGRVITAIYYLNKNWSTKRDGGLLRMFPAGMDTVANIEPLFDRVLFFWSDRRNPHEVLPAFRDRFAITVWYIASETTR